MKREMQFRLIMIMIRFVQSVFLVFAIIAFVIFYRSDEWIGLFCSFLFLFYSYFTYYLRQMWFVELGKTFRKRTMVDWYQQQNRRIRRAFDRKVRNRKKIH